MANTLPKPQAAADAELKACPEQGSGAAAGNPSGDVAESSPIGLQVTDTWADAADQADVVLAKRCMPEPDSHGG